MDRRNAVCAVRADYRQIGHADLVRRPFLDQAYTIDPASSLGS